jgi:hypothetical protein
MQSARATLSSVACPTLQYFTTLSYEINGKCFEKKKLLHKKCVLISSTIFSETSHSKKK